MPYEYFIPLKELGWRGGSTVMMEYGVHMCVYFCALQGFLDKTPREVGFFFHFF